MPSILKVLRAYLVLAGFTVAALVAWRIASTYQWERLGDDDKTMLPTLQPAQVFRVDRNVRLGDLRCGNLVAYVKDPSKPGDVAVGRIVGLPGDRVTILKGEVRVNGELSSDNLSTKPTEGEVPDLLVPRGTFFILVDLRTGWELQRGADSRAFGPISAGRILGRLVL